MSTRFKMSSAALTFSLCKLCMRESLLLRCTNACTFPYAMQLHLGSGCAFTSIAFCHIPYNFDCTTDRLQHSKLLGQIALRGSIPLSATLGNPVCLNVTHVAFAYVFQETERKGSGAQSAAASPAPSAAPSGPRSYADLVRAKADIAASGSAQQSGRPQTPSQPSAAAAPSAAPAQPASPVEATALPQRATGNRNQGRSAPTATSAAAAGSDASGKGEQRTNVAANVASVERSAQASSNASAAGPPARPPYSAPSRGPSQNYRDDESGKKAVFVRNVPQVIFQQACKQPSIRMVVQLL